MKYLSLIISFVFSTYSSLIAQPGMEPPPEEIPISDHIELLFAVFLFLGIYIIIRNKKKSQIQRVSEKSV